MFCLQVNGPVTGGTYKCGEGAYIHLILCTLQTAKCAPFSDHRQLADQISGHSLFQRTFLAFYCLEVISGGRWGLISAGANNAVYFFGLQVNGPVTKGTCKWGERGRISVGAYNRVHCFVYK